MHLEARAFVERVAQRVYAAPARVVEFGSLNINGSVRDLFPGADYWGVDLQSGPGVDEVADAATWQNGTPVDLIVCCEVLEHSPDIDGIFWSAHRNLREGGFFVVTCATVPRIPHSAIDGGPVRKGEFYRNVDFCVAKKIAIDLGFKPVQAEVAPQRGDLYMVFER